MNVLFILAIVAMLAVVAVLVGGLVVMAKGGALNEKYGNRLMVARVCLQMVAIALVLLAVLASKG